ncbi:MAG: hypothetical protein RL095_2050 [Verrucomicrobiota bacterium]|jgi:retron-type reverse transcriptase
MNEEQQLRQRVLGEGKDAVVIKEMVRLGFWPEKGVLPDDPADEIRRAGELRNELKALGSEQARLGDSARQLVALKRQRLIDSRRKRHENKQRRAAEAVQRAEAWKSRQDTEIVYLGEGVSGGLSDKVSRPEALATNHLPDFADEAALAAAMGMSVRALRFLAFHRQVSRVSHYRRFKLKKKSGGERLISAPKRHLKEAQSWILKELLEKVPLHDAAHGFVPGRSIVSNALPHLGCKILINIDLENFFPSFSFRRVKGLFRHLGYSDKIATILALVATEPPGEEVEMDGETWHVATGERLLPQGSPCSPALTNIICRHLDQRMHHCASKAGFVYSRYADDMSFSAKSDPDTQSVGRLMRQINYIVRREGLKIQAKKTKILRQGACREVTGIVVHEKPSICRKKLHAFRSLLHQIGKSGPAGKTWGQSHHVLAAAKGYALYVKMVDPIKGQRYLDQVEALIAKYGWRYQRVPKPSRSLRPLLRCEREAKPALASVAPAAPAPAASPGTPPPVAPAASPAPGEQKPAWWQFWK